MFQKVKEKADNITDPNFKVNHFHDFFYKLLNLHQNRLYMNLICFVLQISLELADNIQRKKHYYMRILGSYLQQCDFFLYECSIFPKGKSYVSLRPSNSDDDWL